MQREEEDKLTEETRICIDTAEDGWVEGEIVIIKKLPKTRWGGRNKRKYAIKTSGSGPHDTIHGYHVGGAAGEVQLHEMDWWTIREQQDGAIHTIG